MKAKHLVRHQPCDPDQQQNLYHSQSFVRDVGVIKCSFGCYLNGYKQSLQKLSFSGHSKDTAFRVLVASFGGIICAIVFESELTDVSLKKN